MGEVLMRRLLWLGESSVLCQGGSCLERDRMPTGGSGKEGAEVTENKREERMRRITKGCYRKLLGWIVDLCPTQTHGSPMAKMLGSATWQTTPRTLNPVGRVGAGVGDGGVIHVPIDRADNCRFLGSLIPMHCRTDACQAQDEPRYSSSVKILRCTICSRTSLALPAGVGF